MNRGFPSIQMFQLFVYSLDHISGIFGAEIAGSGVNSNQALRRSSTEVAATGECSRTMGLTPLLFLGSRVCAVLTLLSLDSANHWQPDEQVVKQRCHACPVFHCEGIVIDVLGGWMQLSI